MRRNDPGLRALPSLLPTPTAQAAKHAGDDRGVGTLDDRNLWAVATRLLPTPSVADATGGHERRGIATHQAWGPYTAAIARWEAIIGPAPAPTQPVRNGRPKLNPAFAEWMMGAPAGWITDTPGVTDNEALRMAGNGVVRQQAVAALRLTLNRMEVAV